MLRAAVGVWIAFLVAAALALPQPPPLYALLIAGVVGAVLIAGGFGAAAALGWPPASVIVRPSDRPLPVRVMLAIAAGAAVGGTLLAVVVWLSRVDSSFGARLAGRAAEPLWRPWALAFESSILEEVVFRLFLMTGAAWLAAKVLRGREQGSRAVFAIALLVSTLAFGAAHLPAWTGTIKVTAAVAGGVLLLNGIGGLVLGWVYWRWGLLLAVLCHAAGDVVLQGLGPHLVG